VQMLYWIGSQRYSTRYYYEALTAAALLTAIPLGWLAHRFGVISRVIVLSGMLGLCVFTLYTYSTPRIDVLHRFNFIDRDKIEAIEALREDDDTPILVIVNGASSGENRVLWRSYGALMAVTDPYFESDIIVARDYGNYRDMFLRQFPDRQVIDLLAFGNQSTIMDDPPTE